MYPSKLGATVAILATAAGFAALAGIAEAQISGSTGGNVVDPGTVTIGAPNPLAPPTVFWKGLG